MTAVAVAAAFGLLLLGPTSARAGDGGLVRVYNQTDVTITVYVLNVDFYGNRSWRPLREVMPRGVLELPNVPAGTTIGAQDPPARRQWPPKRVEFTSGRPIFEYVITR